MGAPKPTESLPTELVGFRAAIRRNSESRTLSLKKRRRHPSILRQVSTDRYSFQRQISGNNYSFQRRSSNTDSQRQISSNRLSVQRQISSETTENLPFRRRSARFSFSRSLPKFTYVCSYNMYEDVDIPRVCLCSNILLITASGMLFLVTLDSLS